MENYNIGVGKSQITYSKIGLYLAGFSDPEQKTEDTVKDIYARAFYISSLLGDPAVVNADSEPTQELSKGIVCIVVVDMWACSKYLKGLVIDRILSEGLSELINENVMISGTHTHSVPGGYTGSKLYDALLARPKIRTTDSVTHDEDFSAVLADNIVEAIKNARNTAAPGKIYRGHTQIEKCGYQRSREAFMANPEAANNTQRSTDTEMTLLKFVKSATQPDKSDTAIGSLCWYPIHPTDLRQANKKVSGDNKGWAANAVENSKQPTMAPDFVAGFANSNCGDVSGNVDVPISDPPDSVGDQGRMEDNGKRQADAALRIFNDPDNKLVTGPIKSFYKEENFSAIHIGETGSRTWPPTLGMSMIAGSSEDSVSRYLDDDNKIKTITSLDAWEGMTIDDEEWALLTEKGRATWVHRRSLAVVLAARFGTPLIISDDFFNWMTGWAGKIVEGHGKKPIVFAPLENEGYIPNTLPLQLFQIGNCGIVGFPGELTTMAGRRLKATLIKNFRPNLTTLEEFMLSCYANDYAQYVTTHEEYNMQHYEGASTPFGPHTLAAFEQEFSELDDHDARILRVTVKKGVYGSIYYNYVGDRVGVGAIVHSFGPASETMTITLPDSATNIGYKVTTKPSGAGKVLAKDHIPILRGQTKNITLTATPSYITIGEPLDQKVKFKNDSSFIVKVWVSFTDRDGKSVDLSSMAPKMGETSDFNLPWDARNVVCKASYQGFWPNVAYYDISDCTVDIRSGEVSNVRLHADLFQKPTIKDDGSKVY